MLLASNERRRIQAAGPRRALTRCVKKRLARSLTELQLFWESVMRTRNVCMALVLISASACGGSGGGSPSTGPKTQPPGNTTPLAGEISVTNNAFSPTTKTVAVGAAVNWAWNTCSGGDGYSGGTIKRKALESVSTGRTLSACSPSAEDLLDRDGPRHARSVHRAMVVVGPGRGEGSAESSLILGR